MQPALTMTPVNGVVSVTTNVPRTAGSSGGASQPVGESPTSLAEVAMNFGNEQTPTSKENISQ